MMNYSEALEYIHSVSWLGSRPGLERIRELMHRLGDPQDRLEFVHVAGTNGKGSVSAMIASVLSDAGYKTGLYTSPFILRFNERISINGVDISDEELADVTEYVRPFADAMEDTPTEFELICAIAFVYFERKGCDVVVLEVGMGGALDSTNIIKTPILSIITGIGMDHMAFLGDTPAEIAKQKAGIIKHGVPVLLGTQHGEFDEGENGGLDSADMCAIRDVIASEAKKNDAKFTLADISLLEIYTQTLEGCDFAFDGKKYHISLLGLYQPYNALTALAAVKILREEGFDISKESVQSGLARVRWRGRFEILSRYPLIISDGAHNPEGIDAAVRSIRKYFPNEKVNIVSGVMADKNYEYMVKSLARVAAEVFCIRPDNSRALDAAGYAEEFKRCGVTASAFNSVKDALTAATKDGRPVLCVGSLYMYGEVRAAIG